VTISERADKASSEQATTLEARAEGAFVAFAAGDALGWPQEFPTKVLGGQGKSIVQPGFRRWTRRGGTRYNAYEEPIEQGEYSDDTQLMLAIARCRRLSGNGWWTEFTRVELPLWTLYARGGGGATKRAAASWLRGQAPWKADKLEERRAYFEAGGNGAAMRVLPHAIFYASQSEPSRLLHDVALDSAATHGHPRAVVGAAVYAYAAWFLLRTRHTLRFGELVDEVLEGKPHWSEPPASDQAGTGWSVAANAAFGSYEKLWNQVIHEMSDLLKAVREGLAAGALADDTQLLKKLGSFSERKGAGTVTAAAVLYECARYAAQPVQAVVSSAFARGADTDTIAAMSGGLVGCLNGTEWLSPDWFRVQDCAYLRYLGRSVAHSNESADRQPERKSVSVRDLEALESSLWNGESVKDFAGLGSVKSAESSALKSVVKNSAAKRLRISTGAGQTLYLTKVSRNGAHEQTADTKKGELYVGRNDAYVFAQRTLANLDHVLGTARENPELHPVTQLANSLLGLVVFPYQREVVKVLAERELSSLDGWPKWDVQLDDSEPSKRTTTLGRLLWHLRNAAAHGRLTFSSDSTELGSVRLVIEDKPNGSNVPVNWRAEISAADLESFCRRLAKLIETELA
jgi:ADP-ribosylglycohydrolase